MVCCAGVAFTSRMLNPKVAANSNYMFQKVFGDNDFIAAGQILIPPGEQKPAKPAKDNTYVRITLFRSLHVSQTTLQVFYLIEGAVQFKVHRSSFIIATGGMFLVPRGECSCITSQAASSSSFVLWNRQPVLHREHM